MKTLAPKPNSFLNFPTVTDWDTLVAQAVIFGCPFGKPYDTDTFPNNQAEAPTALRTATNRILVEHDAIDVDSDTDATIDDFRIVDGGDIPLFETDVDLHYTSIKDAVKKCVNEGIIPISIGGDDGITIPVLRGLHEVENITLIQIDAHLDWRDERFGISDGFSSVMRRASELPNICEMHQIGIRSVGSARKSELEDALKWGSNIHKASDIYFDGIATVIDKLPNNGNFFITLDVDGLDPSILPGTTALAPGGLNWWEIDALIKGISQKGSILGLNVVELAPNNDVNQISMIGVGRIILKTLLLELSK